MLLKFMKVEMENPTTRETCGRCYDEVLLHQELEYLWEDRDASGRAYGIYLGKISRSPIIKSKTTGRYFSLPWSQIIKLAVEEGIDE